jgi:4-hydroxybenzoate polyprenyltransferase
MQQPVTAKHTTGIDQLKYLILGMRPKQWVKNAFVFAGIVFADQHLVTDGWALGRVLLAFVLFCVVSGCVYLMNDLVDIEQDRLHPKKRFRPLPSGHLSPAVAKSATWLLSIGSLALPWLLGAQRMATAAPTNANIWQRMDASFALGWYLFGAVLLVYFVTQIAYTFRLKHMVIIDLFTIAAGFVLRALGGAAVLQVIITPWWLMCVLLLALFLGLGKRRNELLVLEGTAGNHRRILEEYSSTLLDNLIVIVVACTILAYSLATFSAPSVPQKPFPFLMLSIPFVIYALFRYMYLMYQRGEGGTPEEMLLHDRPLLVSILSWGMLVISILLIFERH